MVGSDRNVAMAAKQAALKAFGARLQEARNNTSLTQEDVADKLTVSTQTVRNWEAGRTEPSRSDKERLASLYNKPVEWFFADKEKAGSEEFSPLTPEQVEANLDLVLSAPMIALRAAADDLDDDAIADIADYIRFVREREERRRRERQGEG